MINPLLKYNHNHDVIGRFASGPGGEHILPRATWDHTDFTMARMKLKEDGNKSLNAYNQIIGMRPADFQRGLLGPFADNKYSGLTFEGNPGGHTGNGWIEAATKLHSPGGAIIGLVARIFRPDKTVIHSGMELLQTGAGVGKEVLKSQIGLYQKMGLQNIELEANIHVGSYAWARYGFLPTKNSWEGVAANVKARMKSASILGVTEGALRTVNAAVNNSDPRGIWAIADIDQPVRAMNNLKAGTLGKALLMSNSWDGTLKLNRDDQMERFNAYISR